MKKIKFFWNPTVDLENWLNTMAKKGYRLKSIHNCIYDFEKTDKNYRYATQFIGANSATENESYIEMLKEGSGRVYRAPLNQGSLVLGKIRLRPYARESGKIANSFQGYNKEILVVENEGDKVLELLTNKADLAKQFKDLYNTYLWGFLILLLLFLYGVFKCCKRHFPTWFFGIALIGAVAFYLLSILYRVRKSYKKYEKEARTEE